MEQLTVEQLIGYVAAALVALSTIVQITPIKLYPWTKLGQIIGRWINHEMYNKQESMKKEMSNLNEKIDKLKVSFEERAMNDNRTKILRFSDEICHNVQHSEEHFKEILRCITEYKLYCRSHPTYLNSYADHAMKLVEDTYDKVNTSKSFLK